MDYPPRKKQQQVMSLDTPQESLLASGHRFLSRTIETLPGMQKFMAEQAHEILGPVIDERYRKWVLKFQQENNPSEPSDGPQERLVFIFRELTNVFVGTIPDGEAKDLVSNLHELFGPSIHSMMRSMTDEQVREFTVMMKESTQRMIKVIEEGFESVEVLHDGEAAK